MSADNGIYILDTPIAFGFGREYRVIEAGAIEDISWQGRVFPGDVEEINAGILKEHFGQAKVYTDEAVVLKVARDMAEEIDRQGWPLEYGISFITLNNSWSTYCP